MLGSVPVSPDPCNPTVMPGALDVRVVSVHSRQSDPVTRELEAIGRRGYRRHLVVRALQE
ncbi:hypothetical protein GCM10020216_041500 [Nonomuraea helvata]